MIFGRKELLYEVISEALAVEGGRQREEGPLLFRSDLLRSFLSLEGD